jgi:hypothetical protein
MTQAPILEVSNRKIETWLMADMASHAKNGDQVVDSSRDGRLMDLWAMTLTKLMQGCFKQIDLMRNAINPMKGASSGF